MILFRGSSAGYCSRSIVAKYLDPALGTVDPAKRPFLDAGHYLQEQVEDFLLEVLPSSFSLLKHWRESEGVHDCGGFKIVGHVDGVLLDRSTDKYYLLEVKAIKDKTFKKLQKSSNWREVYPSYQFQAQTYLNFPRLEKDNEALGKEFHGTHFVYMNRDTSMMMTSLPVVHPAVEIREDMYEPRSDEWWERIKAKFALCAEHVEAEDVPDTCDAIGYCFFCGSTGTGFSHVPKRRKVSLEGGDPEQQEIEYQLDDLGVAKENIAYYFKEFNADDIELESGVVISKEDFC